jgi:hypothetical protein
VGQFHFVYVVAKADLALFLLLSVVIESNTQHPVPCLPSTSRPIEQQAGIQHPSSSIQYFFYNFIIFDKYSL